MTRSNCCTVAGAAALCAIVLAPIAAAQATEPSVHLSIREPVKHTSRGGVVDGRDWNLEIRATAHDAVGFVELIGSGVVKEALIVSDDDNCIEIDLQHPVYPGPFESCGDGIAEETYIEFRSDRSDRPFVQDNDSCSFALFDATRMLDDPSTAAPQDSNKAYLLATDQFQPPPSLGFPVESVIPVGPSTGGQTLENCHGYGRDEDLVGLVVMADVGAARVFDQDFNLVEVAPGIRRIRNMAGFLSSVTKETKDRIGRSHVVGHMFVERGMFEPLVAFDTRTGPGYPYTGPTFLRRIDSGPVEEFTWDTIPTTDFSALEYEQLLATLPDTSRVKVRAVLVEGSAPEYIDDLNMDGRFTIVDLVAMGYTPISNQAGRTITVLQQDKLEDFGGTLECPSGAVIIGLDLDTQDGPNGPGNGNGAGYYCQDGDGSSRSFKRIPQ